MDRRADHWTSGDCIRLAALVQQGKTEAQIATEMGRTEKAINIQKSKLGVSHGLPVYCVISPDGTEYLCGNLNAFCESRAATDSDFTMPARKSKASMGLQWALKMGRTWKGWAVRIIHPGTRNRKIQAP